MSLDTADDWVRGLSERPDDPNRQLLSHADYDLQTTLGDLSDYEATDHGDGNRVLRHPEARPGTITFEPGSSGNIVVCGTRQPSRQPIVLSGSGHRVIIGPTKKFAARIALSGHGNLFFSGLGTTCNQANIVLQGQGRSIILGIDCMLSFDVVLRAADSHAIIDLSDMSVANVPESILLGAHVWLGEGASVLKGARVGTGAVVASRALVTGTVPPTTLVVGVPARVLRENVSWTRAAEPGPAQLRELERRLSR
nr:hypothetical protein [Paracoccus saliphilus]